MRVGTYTREVGELLRKEVKGYQEARERFVAAGMLDQVELIDLKTRLLAVAALGPTYRSEYFDMLALPSLRATHEFELALHTRIFQGTLSVRFAPGPLELEGAHPILLPPHPL